MAKWEEQAAEAAAACGNTFLVGVRSKGTWFAHCDGVEIDGSSAATATRGLIDALKRKAEAELSRINAENNQLHTRVEKLQGLT